MLRWALVFLLIGLLALVFGYTSVAGASFAIAKILAFVFLALFIVLLVTGIAIGRRLRRALKK